MMNYWNNLNDREKWLLGLGLISTLIYLFYLLLYSPLISAVDEKETQLKEKQETLIWMQQVRQQLPHKSNLKTISSSKLLTVIATELTNQALQKFPYQLQQTSQGDIQLSFENVPYKTFLVWLWQLNNNYALTLKQLVIEKTATVGLVKLTAVIASKT
ncbi:general secretion pathway protein M [Legionella beliardensis]|uniref:General secretion pathway protein M n=1 Tax=Legionella beliardensis TaxID=91822 RepID=A0A378I3B7_9GAMM|nr:type II secretion system protein GspM [Legionella beliardensis]STX29362.1 general secretion pathway protein M [Legionella beliardensis]